MTLSSELRSHRLLLLLFGIFGSLSIVLAATGVYAVMAQVVGARTREIGVRITLGARPGAVLWLVFGQSLRLIILGVALGLTGVWAASRLLEASLFGVTPTDPPTILTTAGLLTLAAFAASVAPAYRAARIDPVMALRADT